MVALVLICAVVLSDPIAQVQLRYPAARVTVTTASGYNVIYTLAADAPPELRRAYRALEAAEREVLITEALQLLKLELVQSERRLEALRTARLAAYLTDTRADPRYYFADPALIAPPESRLKFCVSEITAADARIERGLAALDRLLDAHYQVRETFVALAHPDRVRPAAGARSGTAAPPTRVGGAAVPAVDAERAEKAAADAEAAAEERERGARQAEMAAEARYRDSLPADRAAARAAWLKARDEWEQARREWDAARDRWKIARDRLGTGRTAPRVPGAGDRTAAPHH